jgi:predicted O-methyltransferase YrrM
MFKWIPILAIISALFFITAPAKYSHTIDLANLKEAQKIRLKPFEGAITHKGFNKAPEIGDFIQALGKDFHIETAIETGTSTGDTTRFLSQCFDEVHTIEVSDETFKTTTENLKNFSNIHFHLGSSEQILPQILPGLKDKRAIFYLDAHWNEYWPLLDELEEIGKTHKDNCIIVIDDFRVPKRRDIQFDQYGKNKCSYKYIAKQLDKVFSNYDYYYVIPKNLASRAKFVAIPKNWAKKQSSVCKAHFEIPIAFLRDLKGRG